MRQILLCLVSGRKVLAAWMPWAQKGDFEMDDFFAHELNARRDFLTNIIKDKTQALASNGPTGRLRCIERDGTPEFYWRKDAKDTNGIYIPKSNLDFAATLAQRTYDQAILNYAKEELRCIDQLVRKHQTRNIESVYENYSLPRKSLVNPIWLPDEEYVSQWLQKEYARQKRWGDGATYSAKNGEKRRSKSEVIINDLLIDYGVPYLYEWPVYLEGLGWRFPDFLTLNVRTRWQRYWEHFGKMDDPEYLEINLDKILYYERNGIFPGTNLIITHETSKKPLDTELIVDIIKHYLL